jgi:carbon catabolite-derepressing protein kinase
MEQEGALDLRLAKTILRQCLLGLQSAHAKGVIHRDMKPENIFVDEHFHLHIGDFGLASVVDTSSTEHHIDDVCGTTSYSAPEVFDWIDEKGAYDGCKADVWSLGCIFFLMLTGNSPFGTDGAEESDWFFRQLKAKRMANFWRGHEKYSLKPIPSEGKILFESIFSLNQAERPSVEDLLTDPWLSDGILQDSELFDEMKEIKSRIDGLPGFEMK